MRDITLHKPTRGTALLARKVKRAARVSAEQKIMQAALKRDGRKCRWPYCQYRTHKLPVDACHLRHRGMGGNPALDRTTTASVLSLCRKHHGELDAGQLDVEPLTLEGCNGPLAFYWFHDETVHRRTHVASERAVDISEPRT